MIDFTFVNPSIRDFFDKDGQPPISELLYLHAHPLIKPNFINQLEAMMSGIGVEVTKRGLSGKIIEDLTQIALAIGVLLPTLNRTNSGEVLLQMKKAYLLGKQLGLSITG